MSTAQLLRGLARHQREVAADLRDSIDTLHQGKEQDLLAAQDLEREAHAASELKNATWWLSLGLSVTSVVRSGISAVESFSEPPAGTESEEPKRSWLDNVQDGLSKPLSFIEGRLAESDQTMAAGKRELERVAEVREKLGRILEKEAVRADSSADAMLETMTQLLRA